MTGRFAELFDGVVTTAVWNQCWQVTVVALLVAGAARLCCRHRPHLAHTLWLLVLVKCVTPPLWSSELGVFSHADRVVSAWLNNDTSALHAAEETAADAFEPAFEAPVTAGAELSAPRDASDSPATEVAMQAEPLIPEPAEGASRAGSEIPGRMRNVSASGNAQIPAGPVGETPEVGSLSFTLVVGIVWFSGFGLCLGLLIVRRALCAVVLRRSRLDVDPWLESACRRIAGQLGVRRRVRLLVTSRSIGPAVFGLLRPVIVLPQRVLEGSNAGQIETILAHELLHLRRGDTAVGLLQMFAQAVWWFHPLVWWANRQIIRERERCCDDEVVTGLGCEPSDYAQMLLDVLKSSRRLQAIPGVPGIRPVELTTRRLEHIMSDEHRFGRTPKRHWLLLLALIALFVPGAALSFPDNEEPARSQPIRLQLDADNKVHVLGRKIEPDQLKPILVQLLKLTTEDGDTTEVRIVADRQARHESVVKLIDICKELGISVIAFAATSADKPRPAAEKPPATATAASLPFESMQWEFRGHRDKVNAVAWSSDGKHVASGSSSGVLRLTKAESGTPVHGIQLGSGPIWSVAISPDGMQIACGCQNGTVQVCRVNHREESDGANIQLELTTTLKSSDRDVWSVAFSPDGKSIAAGTKDAKVLLWNAESAESLFVSDNVSQVSGIRFTPDGSMLATSSVNEPVKLWNAKTGKVVKTFDKAPTFQQWVAVSPNGELIATASWDGSAILWDAKTGKLLTTFEAPATARRLDGFRDYDRFARPQAGHLNCVTFSPDGKLLAAAGADGQIRLWSVEDRKSWGVFDAHSASAMSIAFSPDGKKLVSGGEDHRVRVWSVPSQPLPEKTPAQTAARRGYEGRLIDFLGGRSGGIINRNRGRTVMPNWPSTNGVLQTHAKSGELWTLETVKPRGRIIAINWSPDGDRIAFVDCGSVRIYEVPSMKLVRILAGHAVRDWGQPLAWSPDGETLVTGGYDGTVRLWSENGVPGAIMKAHNSPVAAVRWSPSGDRVASVGYHGGIKTWNVDGTANTTVASSTHWLSSVAWSPDGKKLVVGELHRDASIWKATGGRVATIPFGAHVQTVAWNPEGDIIAVAGGRNEIDLWSADGKDKLKTLTGHEKVVASLDWSIGGDQLASGAWDHTVRLWSREGDPNGTLTGHDDSVVSVAWSPDGVWLASGDSSNSTLRIWTAEGEPGPALRGHSAYATEMKWSPDGKYVAVGGRGSDSNGRVDVWTSAGIQSAPMTMHKAGAISGIAWSPDSTRLATSGGDSAANVWTATGKHTGKLFGFKRWVTDIDWSADGTRAATAGVDGSVRFFNVEADGLGDSAGTGAGAVTDDLVDVAWHPTSGVIASAARDGTIELWEPDGSRLVPCLATFQYDGTVNELSWNRTGSQLVVAGSGGVRFFNSDGTPGPASQGQPLNAASPHWNDSGQLLVADRGGSNLVQLWDAAGTGRNLVRGWGFGFTTPHWNGDGARFVSGGSDKAVYVFRPDGATESVLLGHHDTVGHTAWNPKSNLAVSVANDNTVRCWDTAAGKADWVAVNLRGHRTITFASTGRLIGGEPSVGDEEMVFVRTTSEGSALTTPAEALPLLQ